MPALCPFASQRNHSLRLTYPAPFHRMAAHRPAVLCGPRLAPSRPDARRRRRSSGIRRPLRRGLRSPPGFQEISSASPRACAKALPKPSPRTPAEAQPRVLPLRLRRGSRPLRGPTRFHKGHCPLSRLPQWLPHPRLARRRPHQPRLLRPPPPLRGGRLRARSRLHRAAAFHRCHRWSPLAHLLGRRARGLLL